METTDLESVSGPAADLAISVVQHWFSVAAGALAAAGWVSGDQAVAFAAAAALYIVGVVWTYYNRSGLRLRVRTALGLEAGTTPVELEAEIARRAISGH